MQEGKQKQNTKASKHTRTVRTSSILQLDAFVQVKRAKLAVHRNQ